MTSSLPSCHSKQLEEKRLSGVFSYSGVFWCNDDDDTNDGDQIPPNALDKDDEAIDCKRDLEDFTRLWVYLKGVHEMVKDPNPMFVGLKWKDVTEGNPQIRLFESCEQDGGVQYLEDENVATQQIQGQYASAIQSQNGETVISGSDPFIFPTEIWDELDEENYKKYFLFEGVSEGKGKLQLVFLDQNQNEIGEAPPIYLEITDIKKMYERGKAQPENIPAPQEEPAAFTGPTWFVEDPNGNPFINPPPPDETDQAVVFVHGWSMEYDEYISFSETMFKRLWHQGFKGRFYSFRWDTLVVNEIFDHEVSNGEYNRSEHRAWEYGEALKLFVDSIQAQGFTVNVVGHSMGNVVVGGALLDGMNIQNYVLMQAAVPAGCYNSSTNINNYIRFLQAEVSEPTPDYHNDPNTLEYTKGYRGFLEGVSGNLITFFNTNDFALVSGKKYGVDANWESNQEDYKPDGNFFTSWRYDYDPQAALNQRGILEEWTVNMFTLVRNVNESHEMKAFIARSRSKAVGATGTTGGAVSDAVNLEVNYGFTGNDYDHSGQFNRPIQQVDDLYKDLGVKLGVISQD